MNKSILMMMTAAGAIIALVALQPTAEGRVTAGAGAGSAGDSFAMVCWQEGREITRSASRADLRNLVTPIDRATTIEHGQGRTVLVPLGEALCMIDVG